MFHLMVLAIQLNSSGDKNEMNCGVKKSVEILVLEPHKHLRGISNVALNDHDLSADPNFWF